MKPSGQRAAGPSAAATVAETVILGQQPDDGRVVERAARLLLQGRLVAVPTETVYGVLANADLPEAVERLSRAKGRAENRPYTYLIGDVAVLTAERAEGSRLAERLIERYWPGPLTLVLRVGAAWRGFRLPDDEIARQVVRRAGCRVVAPSANRSGGAEPTTADEVVRELGDRIDLILDGGPCRIGKPSTVVRVDGDRIEILREGAIRREEIEETVACNQ